MKNLSVLIESIDSANFSKVYLIQDTITQSTDLVVYATREEAQSQALYRNTKYPEFNCVVREALIYLG